MFVTRGIVFALFPPGRMASTLEQPVVLGTGFSTSGYKMFELDENVLQALLRDDGSVSIKGGRADEAVLCTEDRTYTLRLAESSNTILLAPDRAPKRARAENDDSDIADGEKEDGAENGNAGDRVGRPVEDLRHPWVSVPAN